MACTLISGNRFPKKMFNGKMSTRGVLMITPEKVIVTTPGPKNNTEL